MQATHPTDIALRDFLLGKLRDEESGSVEAHLHACPECLGRAANEPVHDTLVELLASAHTRVEQDRAAAATPHPDLFSTPTVGVATLSFHGNLPLDPAALVPPTELVNHPKYRVLGPLGVGGMGTVWMAEHTVMGRSVALKVVRPEWLARPGAAERFQREVRAGARLKHENIATAYDAEQVGDQLVLVLEYVPGESLADVVRAGALPVADACRAIRDAARGLAHAHAAGLVHRDVKPGNLIRTPDGTTKVLDFGLVSVAGPEGSALTGENLVMGTPDYIAPEQADNPRAADARSDIYALGCTLYHLLAGRVPYPGDSVLKKIDAHRDPAGRPAPIPGVSPGLAAVVAKMMAKDPRGRYQMATAVLAALEPYASGTAPLSAAGRPRSVPRLAVAAGLLFLSLAAGVVFKIQRDNEQITISADDPDIEVVMKRNGELIRIVDNKTKQSWDLDTKKLRLKPDGSELSIDLPEKGPLVIRRHGDAAVSILREPRGASDPPRTWNKKSTALLVRAGVWIPRVAYHPDGVHLVAGGSDSGIWNTTEGKLEKKLWDMKQWALSVCYSRDGKLVAANQTGTADVVVWDSATGREVTRFGHFPGALWYSCMAFTPDNASLVFKIDDSVYKGDVGSGKMEKVFAENDNAPGLAISPDGTLVAHGRKVAHPTGGYQPRVRIWELATGKTVREFGMDEVIDDMFSVIRWRGDGKRLIVGHRMGFVRVWDIATGKPTGTFRAHAGMEGMDLSRDDARVVTGGNDGHVGLWDLATGKRLAWFTGAHEGGVMGVAFRPDGKAAASGGKDGMIRLWELPEPKSAGPRADLLTGELRRFTHAGSVRVVAFSPDGKQILSGSGWPMPDNTLRLWDVASGGPVWAMKQKFNITAGAFAPNGEVLFGGTSGQGIHRADRKTGANLGRYEERIDSRLLAIAASADGQVVVSGSDDHKIRVWNPTTRTVSRLIDWRQGNVVAVAASADGKLVAGAAVTSVGVWDAKTGAATGQVYQYKSDVGGGGVGLAFTPDRKHLVFGDGADAVLWNVETGVVIRTFAAKNTRHGSACVALSPDGKRLLTGGDRTVRLFDLESGKLLKEFVGHKDRIAAVAFSPDGRFGVSGSGGNFTDEVAVVGGDNTVRVWELPEATKK